jgi:hypothetical protein
MLELHNKITNKTYIYDFDLLTGEQIIIAEACFKIHENMMQKGVKSTTELEATTARTALFKGFGTLLLEKYSDDTLEVYSHDKHPAENIIKNLTAKNLVEIYNYDNGIEGMEGVQWDFFFKLKPSLKKSMDSLNAMNQSLKVKQSELSETMTSITESVMNLKENLNVNKDFLPTENVTDGLENL